jgi:hypothetical protein
METETTTTTTNETKPTWTGEPFARFPGLWKEGGAWRLRVIRQQSQCGSPCWEDTGLMLRNDQVDGMAKVLRAETEAHGEEAVAIAMKKKIPARPIRQGTQVQASTTTAPVAHVAAVRSCAEIMAKKPRLDRVAPVVTLDERKRRQIEAGRKAAETRRRRLAEQQAAQAGA